MGDAIMEAHRLNQELIALQKELVEAVGLPPFELPEVPVDALQADDLRALRRALRESKQIVMKAERNSATRALQETIVKELVPSEKSCLERGSRGSCWRPGPEPGACRCRW